MQFGKKLSLYLLNMDYHSETTILEKQMATKEKKNKNTNNNKNIRKQNTNRKKKHPKKNQQQTFFIFTYTKLPNSKILTICSPLMEARYGQLKISSKSFHLDDF